MTRYLTILFTLVALAFVGCGGSGGDGSGHASPLADAEGQTGPGMGAASGAPPALRGLSNLLGGLGITGPRLPASDLSFLLSAVAASQLTKLPKPEVLDGPPLQPVPRAQCNQDSRPLNPPGQGVQGRVTLEDIQSPESKQGWTCNLSLVSDYDTPGGFRVWRYTDEQGHTCAYYDTSFAGGPLALISLAAGPSFGVVVLNMDDPRHPIRTDTLTSLAMLSPHESLNLNRKRGLLAAVVGNAVTLPGSMAIYDVSEDCRHPELLATYPTITGHESGFSPDGKTFWVAGGFGFIQAIDVSNPRNPREVWRGAYFSHGLNFTAGGKIMFLTDTVNGALTLMDVSEIQARKPNPAIHVLSRVTWPTASIPQNTVPFTSGGHHYLLEFEEFAFRINPLTIEDKVGAARILNIDDPKDPFIVSNIRLEVNMQAQHHAANGDPTPIPPIKLVGYAFHYCAIPTRDNPQIAACTTLQSGLRIFNISDPRHPREVAYYVAPPAAGKPLPALLPDNDLTETLVDTVDTVTNDLLGLVSGGLLLRGNLAFSKPAFDFEHCQVWYTDAISGFYALKLAPKAWPRCHDANNGA